MQITTITQAKSHLSKLIQLACAGEEVIICKAGKPMVKLIKYEQSGHDRTPGYWKGEVHIADDFDELPESFLKPFT